MVLIDRVKSGGLIGVADLVLLANLNKFRVEVVIEDTVKSRRHVVFGLEVDPTKEQTREIPSPRDALLHLHLDPLIDVRDRLVSRSQMTMVVGDLEKIGHHDSSDKVHPYHIQRARPATKRRDAK